MKAAKHRDCSTPGCPKSRGARSRYCDGCTSERRRQREDEHYHLARQTRELLSGWRPVR